MELKRRVMPSPKQLKSEPAEVAPPPIGPGSTGLAALTEAKLWRNPCWFAFRFNHIALQYNAPLYGWIKRRTGLSRPEFVVIYSLGLLDGTLARDISLSSGFPKNTLQPRHRKALPSRPHRTAHGRRRPAQSDPAPLAGRPEDVR